MFKKKITYEVPQEKLFISKQSPIGGIPMGGLGTGTIELRPDGRLHEWEIFNNQPWSGGGIPWAPPIEAEGISNDDSFFLVSVKEANDVSDSVVRMLSSRKESDIINSYNYPQIRNIKQINYNGEFPFVDIDYVDDALPVKIHLEAFSSFIPHDVKNSSLPGITFKFSLQNNSNTKKSVSLMGGLVNHLGSTIKNKQLSIKNTQIHEDLTALVYTCTGYPENHREEGGSLTWSIVDPDASFEVDIRKLRTMSGSHDPLGDFCDSQYLMNHGEAKGVLGFSALINTEGRITPAFQKTYLHRGQHMRQIIESVFIPNHVAWKLRCAEDLRMDYDPEYRWVIFLETRLALQKKDWKVYLDETGEVKREAKDFQKNIVALEKQIYFEGGDNIFDKPCGGLSSKITLEPGESKDISFILSWYFPNHRALGGAEYIGHAYENWFSHSSEIATYLYTNGKELREKTQNFRENLYGTSLPYWLADSLNSQLSTLVKSSFYSKDKQFTVWEGLGCAGVQTFDVVYYWANSLVNLFPELEKSQMMLTVKNQLNKDNPLYHNTLMCFPANKALFEEALDKDSSLLYDRAKRESLYTEIIARTGQDVVGRIPHAFRGGSQKGFDTYNMVDLQPKFVLVTYRDYLAMGDRDWLDAMWPCIKKAMDHNLLLEVIPEGETPKYLPYHISTDLVGQTYDAWDFHGYSAYTSSIWIAALSATVKIAEIMGETNYSLKMKNIYDKARSSMEEILWNGEYYRLWSDPYSDTKDETCMADQLSGQWFANMVGLDPILDPERIKTALRSVAKYNTVFEKGLVNGFLPEQFIEKDSSKFEMSLMGFSKRQAFNPWTGTEYSVASLFAQEGLVSEALDVVKDIYFRHLDAWQIWNQIECGGHYSRALSVYDAVADLIGYRYNAIAKEFVFLPRIGGEQFSLPFITSGGWGRIEHSKDICDHEIVFTLKEGYLQVKSLILPTLYSSENLEIIFDSNIIGFNKSENGSEMILTLNKKVTLNTEAELVVKYSEEKKERKGKSTVLVDELNIVVAD